MKKLSHLDNDGNAHMVDVSGKAITSRIATAQGFLRCNEATVTLVRDDKAPKGAVMATAEIAGIMAAKQTASLIPLCHPLALSKVSVRIAIADSLPGFSVIAEAKTSGVTGVEMEALTAVSVACLTLFDMLKAVDRDMVIEGIEVTSKAGGKSGSWKAND